MFNGKVLEELQSIQKRAHSSHDYLIGGKSAAPTGQGDILDVQKKGREHKRIDSGVSVLPHIDEEQPKDPSIPVIRVHSARNDSGQTLTAPGLSSQPQTYRMEQTVDLNELWVSSVDNNFAKALFMSEESTSPAPSITANSAMCEKCSTIDFLSPELSIPFDKDELVRTKDDCGICAVIHEALVSLEWDEKRGNIVREVKPEKPEELALRVAVRERPGAKGPLVLSLYADPRTAKPDVKEVAQLGYPDLPATGSPQQYKIMRAWRDTCDHQHERCYPWKTAEELPPMPTRVIDVGTASDNVLRVIETSSGEPSKHLKDKYIALSHCWGQLKDNEKFCTTKDNLESNKLHIDFDRLPKSFRDAVTVTRQLEIRYLWIDSICIIQQDTADWEREAQKMGDVFRFAYCTLAASSATSSLMGFTGNPTAGKPRVHRKVAALTTARGSRLYVCRNIDNFHEHVESLFLRLYWECGKGVHCETLGKLNNAKAALMGDAQFPEYVLQYFKGGRIVHFQHLYQMYSSLNFTHWSDRAVALLGLESRLGDAFNTRAEFGILQVYLQRSLLWKRAQNCHQLDRISQPKGVYVPSWSWMAYQGEIGYIEVPPKVTNWLTEKPNMENPFDKTKSLRVGDGANKMRLKAFACGLVVTDAVDWSKSVTMDDGSTGLSDIKNLKCIIIGQEIRDRGAGLQYSLIVKKDIRSTDGYYQRVGVGSLLPGWVQENEKVEITLV